jgi:Spy/CpxP family protein refolding chaperone
MITGLRKSRLLLILTLVLSLGIASLAWAGPDMGGGCGMGPGKGGGCGMGSGMMGHGMCLMNLTPEQAGQAFDMRQKFMNDTAGLRKQMLVQRAELRELWKAKDPDKAKIEAKQKEMNAVRDQLQAKATAFKLEMRKQFPDMAGGPGMGACPKMAGGKAQGACPMMGGDKAQDACPMMAPAAEGAKK